MYYKTVGVYSAVSVDLELRGGDVVPDQIGESCKFFMGDVVV